MLVTDVLVTWAHPLNKNGNLPAAVKKKVAKAVLKFRNSYRAVLAGIQEVQAFEQASISAESALEATQAGFEVGTRTIVDVLIAEQRKYQAQRDNSVARHAYIIRHLRLKSIAGLLTSEDLRVVNQLLE